jgi:hypothetical protein
MKKNSDQLFLFDQPSLNVVSRLKAAMRESVKRCRLSRDQLADQMTEAIRTEGLPFPGNSRSISKAILDKWLSESARHIIPLSLLPVFCAIAGDWLPIQVVAKPLGLTIISERERKLLEWADAEIRRREASKRARKLAEDIGL